MALTGTIGLLMLLMGCGLLLLLSEFVVWKFKCVVISIVTGGRCLSVSNKVLTTCVCVCVLIVVHVILNMACKTPGGCTIV